MRLEFADFRNHQCVTGDRAHYSIEVDDDDDWVALAYYLEDDGQECMADLYSGPDLELAKDACQEYEDE